MEKIVFKIFVLVLSFLCTGKINWSNAK